MYECIFLYLDILRELSIISFKENTKYISFNNHMAKKKIYLSFESFFILISSFSQGLPVSLKDDEEKKNRI